MRIPPSPPDNAKAMMDHGKTLVSWQIDEYQHYQRGVGWYVGAALVGGGLLVYALFTLNFLFALILVIFGIILAMTAGAKPRRIPVSITEDGMEIGHRFIPWKDARCFWIIYEPPEVKNLYLDFKSPIRPHLSLCLEQTDPNVVRRSLLPYVEEDLTKEDEPLTDFLARVMKI